MTKKEFKEENKKPENLKEAFDMGYKNGRVTLQQGYVSRKGVDPETVNILVNKRSGEYYYLAPNWQSTRYCIRQYLVMR